MGEKRRWLALPGLSVIVVFAVAPLFAMLYFSFQGDSPGAGFTLDNYTRFFEKQFYLSLTWSTIKNSIYVTLVSLAVSYPLAYVMAKKLKGARNIVLVLIIIPFFTNQLVRVYSWLIFLQDGGIFESALASVGIVNGPLGLLYTRAAVVIGLVHAFFPYMAITIYLALEKLDNALLEASASLGASKFVTFRRITLPLSRPGVAAGVLLVFVPCLGTFVEPRILGGVNGMVIGTVIEDQFFRIYGWNFGAAIAFILLAMVLVSVSAFSRLGRGESRE
ncbi:MAG: ABC transporter permease [Clostridiales bacterium]|nr:ABC transporter permease [Clostridiales bacterium]